MNIYEPRDDLVIRFWRQLQQLQRSCSPAVTATPTAGYSTEAPNLQGNVVDAIDIVGCAIYTAQAGYSNFD